MGWSAAGAGVGQDPAAASAQEGPRRNARWVTSKRRSGSTEVRRQCLGDEIATAIARHREAPDAHAVIPAHMEGTPSDAFALPYGLRVINGIDVPALGGVVGLAARLQELVVRWRGAPVAPPPPRPAADPRCAPAVLHARLCKLLDVQFEEVVMRAGLERTQIAAATAPQHRRALDVVGMVTMGGPEVCRRVCAAVESVAPWLT